MLRNVFFLIVIIAGFSCSKISDFADNIAPNLFKKKEKILDSIIVSYTNPTLPNYSIEYEKTYFKYNALGICDTSIKLVKYKNLTGFSKDTLIYSKISNIIYRKSGKNGTITKLGNINPDGYLQNERSSSIIYPTSIINGSSYTDTIENKYNNQLFNKFGLFTKLDHTFYGTQTYGTTFPIYKATNIISNSYTYTYNNTDLIQQDLFRKITSFNSIKRSSITNWVFSNYPLASCDGLNFNIPLFNAYEKSTTNYTLSEFNVPLPTYYWTNPQNKIVIEQVNQSSISKDGIAYCNRTPVINVLAKDIEIENGNVKSYKKPLTNPDDNINFSTTTFFYH